MLAITSKRKIWYLVSGTLVSARAIVLILWGLKFGIDFTGGSLLELKFTKSIATVTDLRTAVTDVNGQSSVTVQPGSDQKVIIRFSQITESVHSDLMSKIRATYADVSEFLFDAIGPTIGNELRQKTLWAIILSAIGMIVYISFAFRKITRPVPSWQYGTLAIVALIHNLIITAGVFAVLGKFYNLEVNASFVAAMLTIFGYSVNDTVVVFDRIRDNLIHHPNTNFAQLVEDSIQHTFRRSTTTGFSVLLALLAILAFGGETIRDFTLAMIIGIAVGTYSSIFLAAPLLV